MFENRSFRMCWWFLGIYRRLPTSWDMFETAALIISYLHYVSLQIVQHVLMIYFLSIHRCLSTIRDMFETAALILSYLHYMSIKIVPHVFIISSWGIHKYLLLIWDMFETTAIVISCTHHMRLQIVPHVLIIFLEEYIDVLQQFGTRLRLRLRLFPICIMCEYKRIRMFL